MKITVTINVGERYDALVNNEVALDLPGGIPKGADLVKEHLTGFVQDAIDVLIPKTISDLDEKIASLAINADTAESVDPVECNDDGSQVDGVSGSTVA